AGGQQVVFDVPGGFLSVTSEGVTVLAESATPATPAR
ncbi:F0F1 ATP synthase subunit epsilon, partial [Micromonospora sp. D75]|nr:F0F1 ATP synthase subunit epsilon [Micromonospora sp. D75]